jgi:PAS domain S-box-containing protein
MTHSNSDLPQAEHALRERERLLDSLIGLLPGSAYRALADEHWTALFISKGIEDVTGYPPEEFTSRRLNYNDIMLPEDRSTTRAAVDTALRERTMYDLEHRIRHKDGSVRWIWARGHGVFDEDGSLRFIEGWNLDITPRKQAEEELRHVNTRLELAVRGSNIGIWDIDMPDGDFRHGRGYSVNIWEQLGYERPDSPFDHETAIAPSHPDDRTLQEEAARRYLAGETSKYEVESRARHKDGTYRWRLARGVAVRDAQGKPIRFVGTGVDITDRKRAEEALRESEERFRGTFENAAVGIVHVDATGRFLRVNETFCAIVGYSREELLERTYQDITHPDDLAASIEATTALFRGDSPHFGLEKRFVRKDGAIVWVQVFVSLQRDAAGIPAYDIGIVHDITARRRLEEALRVSEERCRFLIQSIPQKIFTANANGDVDYFNQPWTEFTGRPFDQIKDWGWLEFIHPEDVEENVRRWQHSIDTGEPFQLEHRFRRADGVYRWHLSRALAMRDAEGRVLMWFGANTDIDDQKRAAEAFKQAKEAAEAANRAKDEFLANVSHEIRTPMNAILGMTDLALDTPLAEDQRQYLTTVKSAGDALLGIINDILDFAKIEAGRLELDRADFSLASVLGTTLRALGVRAHKKGLELVCQQPPDVPDALIGDAGRLRQVLINLVGNAIKFTERGEVVVLVENAGEPAPPTPTSPEEGGEVRVRLRFAVTDTGIGIPPEKQVRIFQAFEQEDTSTTRKYGGTGLGLTIAARLVALMGGGISVDSVPGKSSTFGFTACFGLQSHPTGRTADAPRTVLHGVPVLIVDDNATNRHILEEWVRGHAMDTTAAGDGVTAMAALWRGVAQGRPYPLALLDGRMPDIDGLALAEKIRQHVELSATRIILLTSGERPGDLARAPASNQCNPPEACPTTRIGGDGPARAGPGRICQPSAAGPLCAGMPGSRAAAHSGGGGQRVQPGSHRAHAGTHGTFGRHGYQRTGGSGAPGSRAFRPIAAGHTYAGNGRFRGRWGDPGARANGRKPPAGCRLDRPISEGGSRKVPASGDGRVPRQAVQRGRPVGSHGPSPENASSSQISAFGPTCPVRLVGRLRERPHDAAKNVQRTPVPCAGVFVGDPKLVAQSGRVAATRNGAQVLWHALGVFHHRWRSGHERGRACSQRTARRMCHRAGGT